MSQEIHSSAPARRPMAIPAEYSGRWVALNRDRSSILGAADHLDELISLLGLHDRRSVVFYKVPRSDRVWMGGS